MERALMTKKYDDIFKTLPRSMEMVVSDAL